MARRQQPLVTAAELIMTAVACQRELEQYRHGSREWRSALAEEHNATLLAIEQLKQVGDDALVMLSELLTQALTLQEEADITCHHEPF